MNPADLTLKLDRARWWLLSQQPFYGSLAMSLPDVLTNPHGKTACTDATRVYWSPAFLAQLTDEETRFVLAHETLHCGHGHFWRFPKTDGRTNQACDHAINNVLSKIDGMKMPAGGLCDRAFAGLAEEEILNKLPQDPQGDKGQKPADDPCGNYTEAPPDAQDGAGGEGETLKDQWKEKVIQAAQAARAVGRGLIPADMQRELDRTLAQKIDWRRELSEFVKDAQASRNDWTRSARRMATAPVIYPRRRADDIGLIVCVRDTSGSIDDKLCAEFTALIEAALGETGARALVIDCDAAIQREHWIGPGEEIDRKASGGGGTDFTCIEPRLAELADAGERIAGVIVLTDLCGSQFDPGEIASLWLCTEDTKSTHGRTVRIEA